MHPLSLTAVVETLAPATTRDRPPVWRRTGAYERLVAMMIEQLPRQVIPDGPNAGATPLERVNLESQDDLISALVRAWASVADVLFFYQERIANEGYLRTAVEERSIFELARLIGYRPDPGLAAATHLAFTIGESRGIAPDIVVPAGTRVVSIPSQGDRPQSFETASALSGRAEWNAMRAAPPEQVVRQRVGPRAHELWLEGDVKLATGEPLLLVDGSLTGVDQSPRWRAVTVRSALSSGAAPPRVDIPAAMAARLGPRVQRRSTHVTWDLPTAPRLDDEIDSPVVYTPRERARLFGWDAADWTELTERERGRHVDPVGGVGTSSDGGVSWQPPTEGLPKAEIKALTVDKDGRVFAGTAGRGVARSLDGGATWQTITAGLTRRDVRSLAVDSGGAVYAGCVGGVYRSLDAGSSWELVHGDMRLRVGRRGIGLANTRLPNVAVRAVAAYVNPSDLRTFLFAATDAGVFRSRAAGEGWEPVNNGLPGAGDGGTIVVNALAVHQDSEHIYVGTDQGVYYSRDAGERWLPVNDGLPLVETRGVAGPAAVTSLLTYTDRFGSDTYILAVTAQGLFRAIDPDTSWTHVAPEVFGNDAARITSLAVWFDDRLHVASVLAGTDRGLLRSVDHADTWRGMGDAVAGAVAAVAAGGRRIAAAVPTAWPSHDEWPGFRIEGDEIDLDDTYLGITSGSWLLLREPRAHGEPLEGLYPVLEARRVMRRDFGRRRVVTRVVTRADERLATFDPRRTLVYARPQELPLAQSNDPSVRGREITLSARLNRGLDSGRTAIVGGRRARARLIAREERVPLRDIDGRLVAEVSWGESLIVLALPALLPDGRVRHRLRHAVGGDGWLVCGRDDVLYESAADDDATVEEVVTVAATVLDDGRNRSRLVLADPLANVYDGRTLVVRGNVALATHGETVHAEVLGSGDYQLANQRFPLRRAPLTWVRDPETGGRVSTLSVYVNKVRWTMVDSLHDAGPSDHCYSLETDENGVSYVVFGDGVMGARLPSGFENVVATYRSGIGADGEVRADSLVQPMARPLGLRAVTNPLPASGAASPERPEEMRLRAPQHARALRRIVSREDYVDFARTYPGVAKVDARLLWDGRDRLIHITVAARAGAGDEAGLGERLAQDVAAARAGSQPVQVDSCERREFEVHATIRMEPGRLTDDVAEDARAALYRAFGQDARELGQSVAASDVVALLQDLPGVAGVDLDRLALVGDRSGQPPAFLRAELARWDAALGRVRPAQLLTIAADGVRVTVERS
jgi:photosystem II stability/assembly factor-like uncharacterized protein